MTPEQQAAVEAYKQHGSQRLAADALGISRSALRDRLANAEKWQEAPEGQKAAIEASGLDIGTAKHGWRVIQHEDGSRDSVFWKAEAADRKQFLDDLKEAFSDIKPVAAIDPPSNGLADLMTVYPLMDAHIGMHAWGRWRKRPSRSSARPLNGSPRSMGLCASASCGGTTTRTAIISSRWACCSDTAKTRASSSKTWSGMYTGTNGAGRQLSPITATR